MQFCMYVVMVFVLSFGSYTIITSRGLDFDIGQFSAILTYNFMILMSLMMLSMVFVMITMAGESAKRIVEVINEKSTMTNPESRLSRKISNTRRYQCTHRHRSHCRRTCLNLRYKSYISNALAPGR